MEAHHARRCGAMERADGSILWRVWAPRADQVDLVLLDADGRPRVLSMRKEEHGYFQHAEADVAEGQRYRYRLNGTHEWPDPCSLWQPDGVHGPSAVVRPSKFRWTDQNWKGVPREDLVIYELHVGTFTPEGTFEAVIPRLESLKRLGVTALEIMPVGQFPGTRNWGYDGVYPYAVQDSYGGPRGLQKLVDACHAAGLAAILDVVYNHLGPEGNYLGQYGPYFTEHYRTGWGSAVNFDGPGSEAVRDYALDNARMWVEEFHFDGLRLDAVHAIFDLGARHILAAIQETVNDVGRRAGRQTHVIAESDLNDPRLLLPPGRGGYGLDAQWSDDFHHAVHSFVTGERQGYYEDFGSPRQLARVLETPFLYAGDFSAHRGRKHGAPPPPELTGDRFVVAIQNHDQVGNRARGDRLSTLVEPPSCRLAASLLLFAPHLPLLFMGEEYGEKRPFLFFCSFCDEPLVQAVREGRKREFAAFAWQGEVPDPHGEDTFAASKLSWSWPEGTWQAGLRRLYADLLAARRRWPALRDFTTRAARLLPDAEAGKVLLLVRGGTEAKAGQTAEILFNLSPDKQPLPPGVASAGHRVLFSSEAAHYQGQRPDGAAVKELLPHECVAFGPAAWSERGAS